MCLSVECAFPYLRKRGVASRKSAFCGCDVTEKRSLARARRARLTEKRILRVGPHGKAHFGRAPGTRLTKRRTLAVLELAKCVFP